MNLRFWIFLILTSPSFFSSISHAKQWGLVVGINEYPKLNQKQQLQGAVNDAKLIAQTLRQHGVELPSENILLDNKATVSAFRFQYKELLNQARPGDEIIITYAGHGGQEQEFDIPFDEPDKLDETLMFHDFDPGHPQQGRLSDDELYSLLAQAKDVAVLFIADSCHSGGITRSASIQSALPQRGMLDVYQIDPKDYHSTQTISHDDRQMLPHVTYLAATEDESLQIPEINDSLTGSQTHGALSWSVAEAIGGKADSNGDTKITRAELISYVEQRVATLTDRLQKPGLKPRGDGAAAFMLGEAQGKPSLPTIPPASEPLAVKMTGAPVPSWATSVVAQGQAYRLQFVVNGDEVAVYNPHGDQVTAFNYQDRPAWESVIAKYRLLQALDRNNSQQKTAPTIRLAQGDGLHSLKERLEFSFAPNSGNRYFYLFDLSGTGQLQWLYPSKKKDTEELPNLPYSLLLKVAPPKGEDDLVAIFCPGRQAKLLDILRKNNGSNAPDSKDFMAALENDCQTGRYQFFTAN